MNIFLVLVLGSTQPAFTFQNQQWKDQISVWNPVKVNISLTLNRFHIFFLRFHCWLWTIKYLLGTRNLKYFRSQKLPIFKCIFVIFLKSILHSHSSRILKWFGSFIFVFQTWKDCRENKFWIQFFFKMLLMLLLFLVLVLFSSSHKIYFQVMTVFLF